MTSPVSTKRGRSSNGSGELRWLADGRRYQLRVSIPGEGRRTIGYFSVAAYGSKRAAFLAGEAKRREVVGELAAHRFVATSRTATVEDAVRTFLSRRSGREKVTTDGYEDRAEHIFRHLGKVCLHALTGQQIENFYQTLSTCAQPPRGRPLSPKTIGHVTYVLNRALNLAVAQGLARVNPIQLEGIKGPRKRKRVYNIFDASEVDRLVEAASGFKDVPWLTAAVLLMARCALRPGEALALMRSDFKDNALMVQRSISTLRSTKTDYGFRTILVDDAVISEVNRWLNVCPDPQWVFPAGMRRVRVGAVPQRDGATVGKPVCVQTLDKMFVRLLATAGLAHRRPYDLRHTAITHAIAYARVTDGVSIQDVAAWAGHAKSSTTLDTYTHLLPVNSGVVVTMARAYRTELFRIRDARCVGVQPGEEEDTRDLAIAS